MAENVNINVSADDITRSLLNNRSPEQVKIIFDLLKLLVYRDGVPVSDVQAVVAPIIAQLSTLQQKLTEIEAIMGPQFDALGNRIDAASEKSDKAFLELRKALDDALETQITQEELAAAIQEAKDAQKAEDMVAVDQHVSVLSEKLTKHEVSLQKIDDIVPDALEPSPPVVQPPFEPVP